MILTMLSLYWGNGNNQTSWDLLDTVSELMLTLGAGASGGQVISGVFARLTHSRSSGSLNSSCGYFPSPRM